ncbi:MAG: hypothetical protein GY937_28425 [bacterium]|nr:hypothetical protein [bacterium]
MPSDAEPSLNYSQQEPLGSRSYYEPLIAGGIRCHGGFDAVREDPLVAIPGDFVLVGRSFGMLSGIGHTLGARANVLQAMGGG